jgi:hypothetical protein
VGTYFEDEEDEDLNRNEQRRAMPRACQNVMWATTTPVGNTTGASQFHSHMTGRAMTIDTTQTSRITSTTAPMIFVNISIDFFVFV